MKEKVNSEKLNKMKKIENKKKKKGGSGSGRKKYRSTSFQGTKVRLLSMFDIVFLLYEMNIC